MPFLARFQPFFHQVYEHLNCNDIEAATGSIRSISPFMSIRVVFDATFHCAFLLFSVPCFAELWRVKV